MEIVWMGEDLDQILISSPWFKKEANRVERVTVNVIKVTNRVPGDIGNLAYNTLVKVT